MHPLSHLLIVVRAVTMAVLLFPCSLLAQGDQGTIVIEISGLKNSDGQVGLLLFSKEEGFPMDHTQAVKSVFARINQKACRVMLEHIPHGVYGISVFHDENGDGQLHKNIFGKPREGIGASENPPIRFGPPKFEEARFTLDSNKKRLAITMQYL